MWCTILLFIYTCISLVSEIRGTFVTREELEEQMDELFHVCLLPLRGSVGEVGRHGVQEGPGIPPESLPVQGTVVSLWHFLKLAVTIPVIIAEQTRK